MGQLNLVDHGLDRAVSTGYGGSIASILMNSGFDPLALRPWQGKDGRTYIAHNTGESNADGSPKLVAMPVQNSVSSLLRKDDWLVLDQAIVKVAKSRLRFVADIRGAGLQFTIPNGLGKMVLDTERQSDVNEAMLSMDGIRESYDDRPVFDLSALPLPIIHKDFHFSARQLMASRNGGSPLDTTMAELAARRVAEVAEQLALGTASSFAFGGGTVYGLTNFPDRLTKVMTAPTAGGWTPATTIKEILAMRLQAQQAKHFGPYMLYTSLDWDGYMDDDYKTTNTQPITLRERIQKIQNIMDVRTLDFLPDKTMVLVQMTPDVIREVVGMDITTVQWESKGGMQVNFKVMAILVPQVRSDYNHNTGVVHGTYT